MQQLILTIPEHQTISWNTLYQQKHWKVRQSLAQVIHTLILSVVDSDQEIFTNKVDVTLTAYYRDNRLRDSDNIASKLYIDGLKGRVLIDDNVKFVRKVTTEAITGAERDELIIEIKEVK